VRLSLRNAAQPPTGERGQPKQDAAPGIAFSWDIERHPSRVGTRTNGVRFARRVAAGSGENPRLA
jgi:hypothetical protein